MGIYKDNSGKVKKLNQSLDNIVKQSNATEVSNIFTLDLTTTKSFTITITNTTAKTITFSNVPSNMDFSMPVAIKLVCTGGNTISTFPTGTVWADNSVPTFNLGKTYYLTFIPTSTGWHATSMGEW